MDVVCKDGMMMVRRYGGRLVDSFNEWITLCGRMDGFIDGCG
jgi:hypothetical protein